ncbi:hypothetical protein ACSVDE_01635 [Pseudalkalibacillus sp. Hm43]|uniref:hypothetical protein n=1 Tax=Pseudalkalibacillus sp. Hm43 TaxID=3450742 RepID=UPI003F43119C
MMFDVERLRSAIIFLGICVLLGSCAIGNSNTQYVDDTFTDYSSNLWEINNQLEILNQNIEELTKVIKEQEQ